MPVEGLVIFKKTLVLIEGSFMINFLINDECRGVSIKNMIQYNMDGIGPHSLAMTPLRMGIVIFWMKKFIPP